LQRKNDCQASGKQVEQRKKIGNLFHFNRRPTTDDRQPTADVFVSWMNFKKF